MTRGLKDVELVLQTAKESQMPMPLASLVRDRLISAVAKGRGDIDWTDWLWVYRRKQDSKEIWNKRRIHRIQKLQN
jgi:3-hydroxyisobutyrate dehydrogenase-like beta-hydroxyacid dehydrogenase